MNCQNVKTSKFIKIGVRIVGCVGQHTGNIYVGLKEFDEETNKVVSFLEVISD